MEKIYTVDEILKAVDDLQRIKKSKLLKQILIPKIII